MERLGAHQHVAAHVQDGFARRVDVFDHAVGVVDHDAVGQRLQHAAEVAFASAGLISLGLELHHRHAQRQQLLDLTAERLEHRLLAAGDGARLHVGQSQGSDHGVVGIVDRDAAVEPEMWRAADEAAPDEAWIARGVLDDHQLVEQDRHLAHRPTALDVVGAHAQLRLEPVALARHESDEGDRHPTHLGGQHDDVVEGLFGRRVEHVETFDGVAKSAQPHLVESQHRVHELQGSHSRHLPLPTRSDQALDRYRPGRRRGVHLLVTLRPRKLTKCQP